MNIEKIPQFQFAHIGINSENTEEAIEATRLLTFLFGLDSREGADSFFNGHEIEIIKTKGRGRNGHIAFYTPVIKEAMEYLSTKGITFAMDSAKYNEADEIVIIYMEQEVNGFAIHLTSKGKK